MTLTKTRRASANEKPRSRLTKNNYPHQDQLLQFHDSGYCLEDANQACYLLLVRHSHLSSYTLCCPTSSN